MNRDDLLKAVAVQPFDTDVQVNVSGTYVDVLRVRYDAERHSIVVDLEADDVTDALSRFFRIQREHRSRPAAG